MAKFYKAEDEVQDLVHTIAGELGLDRFMDFEALYVPKAKEVVTVQRANKLAEYLSNREDLVLIMIFGDIFDEYDDHAKYMAVRMAMDVISFDSEKDKIIIGTEMLNIPNGFYEVYKQEAVDTARLGIHSIAQWEEKKKREKEEKKNKKGKKHE